MRLWLLPSPNSVDFLGEARTGTGETALPPARGPIHTQNTHTNNAEDWRRSARYYRVSTTSWHHNAHGVVNIHVFATAVDQHATKMKQTQQGEGRFEPLTAITVPVLGCYITTSPTSAYTTSRTERASAASKQMRDVTATVLISQNETG